MSAVQSAHAAAPATDGSGRERTLHLLAAVFATLLPLVVHHDLFAGNVLWYALDHAQLHYPRFVILCDALQGSGEIPHWQHLLYGGAPFHANPELPTLYPPALVVASLFEPARAINLFIAFHMALGGLGAFCLIGHLWRTRLGRSGRGTLAATLGSTLFTLNYYTRLENVNLVEYGAAHMLLPWILLALEGVWCGRRPGIWAAALALLGGLLANTGGLYVLLFGSLFCAIWTLRFGLFDGARARQRTLRWIVPAVLVAGCLALAKLTPYFAWLPTTNRIDPVSAAIASARGLGGNTFTWEAFATRVGLRTGFGVGVALFVLGAVAGFRHALVRLLVGVAVVTTFFAAGPFYGWLYALGPPFTLVRTGPDRLWTLVNMAWPIVAALGVGLFVRRLARERARAVEAVLVFALPLVLLPALMKNRASFDAIITTPETVEVALERYRRWPRAIDEAGDEWRVWWISKPTEATDGQVRTLGGKNEQLVTTALRAETLAGFLGYVWPRTLERHLYFGRHGLLTETQRQRRAGILSARWLVSASGRPPRQYEVTQTDPAEVEGRSLVDNRFARPRVFEPRVVVAVVGDDDLELTYQLLDDLVVPIDVALVHYPMDAEIANDEAAAWDVILDVDGAADRLSATATGDVARVFVASEPSDEQWRAIGAALGGEGEPRAVGTLERDGPNRTRIAVDPASERRFVVVSEAWSTNPGFEVTVGGDDAVVRRSDGLASAVLVPAGASAIAASYRTPGARTGYAIGTLGLVGLLVLALAGWRPR